MFACELARTSKRRASSPANKERLVSAAVRELPILDVSHGPQPREAAGYFRDRSAVLSYDPAHRKTLRKAIGNYDGTVVRGKSRFLDHESARRKAAAIKREAILNLDKYLEEFERNVVKNGGVVHWAEGPEQARDIIIAVAKKAGVTHVVKGKSM